MSKLSEKTREEIITHLLKDNVESMSYQDQIEEYLLNGLNLKGYNNMTDEELVEEYGAYIEEDDSLLIEAKAELAIEKMIDPINHCQQCDVEINEGERVCDDWDCASRQHDEES